jgi:hypothetical protein
MMGRMEAACRKPDAIRDYFIGSVVDHSTVAAPFS